MSLLNIEQIQPAIEHRIYKCFYCSNACNSVHKYTELNISVVVWNCNNCDAKFLVEELSNTLLDQKMYVNYKNKKYCAHFTYDDLVCTHKFELTEVINTMSTEPILTLDYHPDFNPQNIKQKISTLITFS